MDVTPSSPKACDVLLGTPEALLDLFFPDKETESSSSNISKYSLQPTTCLQEVHGKYEYLQAIQVLASRFRFFGTLIPDYENAGGIGYLHSQGPSARRDDCDTFDFLSRP